MNQASAADGDVRAVERHFSRAALRHRVSGPYDLRLRTMLDSGTYALGTLKRSTRYPIKQLGLAVAERLR